jgi:hypothetical protein
MNNKYKSFDQHCDAILDMTDHALNHLYDLEQKCKVISETEGIFKSKSYYISVIYAARTELNKILDALREIEDDCEGITESIEEIVNHQQSCPK